MQVFELKKIIFYLFFFLGISQLAQSQTSTQLRNEAKKYYKAQNIGKSIAKYEKIWENDGYLHLKEFQRLSYLKSKTGDYTENLYILSLILKKSPSISILNEIKRIAQESNIEGYDFNQFEILMLTFSAFRLPVLCIILVLLCFIFSVIVYKSFTKNHVKIQLKVFFCFFLLLTIILIKISQFNNVLIVKIDNCILRNQPSASGRAITELPKGTRLKKVSSDDIWIKIDWKNQDLYIKQDQVWKL